MSLDVSVHRSGRASIDGVAPGSTEVQSLRKWLFEREDVLEVHAGETGKLSVRFRDGDNLPGHFIRALRDEVSRLARQDCRPEPYVIEVVHSLRGRVRVRAKGIPRQKFPVLCAFTSAISGVKSVRYLRGSDTILAEYDPRSVSERKLLETLRKSDPSVWSESWQEPPKARWGSAVASTAVVLGCLSPSVPFALKALGISAVSYRPTRRMMEALAESNVSIDTLDVAATFAALATGRPATAAFVIWMVGIGDLLLDLSANSARNALARVIGQRSQEALLLGEEGKNQKVFVERLRPGDRILVQAGQSVPVDGRVRKGHAEVDEKALTGESRLVFKKKHDAVLAGTLVVEGRIAIEVERTSRDTQAAKIERVLATVGNKPLTLQKNALDFAGRLVLPTFGIAGIAALLSRDLTRAVCVLITDFGTGFRIAVPTSALTAMALAARQGMLIKGAQYLERLSKADVIVFDKTGTLTTGQPEVVEVITSKRFSKERLIELAASAERGQSHPVAKALQAYASKLRLELTAPRRKSVQLKVGHGLSADVGSHRVHVGRASWMRHRDVKLRHFKRHLARLEGDQVSNLCVAVDGEVVGIIGYSDGTRPESAAILEKLRANGRRRLLLLSGDSPEVAAKVARELGIDEAVGSLLPDQKAGYIRDLRKQGRVVAMVGDGINDAPALAEADVGISIAGSTDVALETADIVLLDGGLLKLPRVFEVADEAMVRVKQNLGVIIVPNAIAIALGALGLISPPIAAIINNGATILAVLTSLKN